MNKKRLINLLKIYDKDLRNIAKNLYKTSGSIKLAKKEEVADKTLEPNNNVFALIRMGNQTLPLKFCLEDFKDKNKNLNKNLVWEIIEYSIKVLVDKAAIIGFR